MQGCPSRRAGAAGHQLQPAASRPTVQAAGMTLNPPADVDRPEAAASHSVAAALVDLPLVDDVQICVVVARHLRVAADQAEADAVASGRSSGLSWDRLGVLLSMSGDTLRRRYGALG